MVLYSLKNFCHVFIKINFQQLQKFPHCKLFNLKPITFVFNILFKALAGKGSGKKSQQPTDNEDSAAGDEEGQFVTPRRRKKTKSTAGFHWRRPVSEAEDVPDPVGRALTEDDRSVIKTGEVSVNSRVAELQRRSVSSYNFPLKQKETWVHRKNLFFLQTCSSLKRNMKVISTNLRNPLLSDVAF
jgi:hypothetical protein